MTEYTPTTDEVRAAYVRAMRQAFVAASSEHEAEFERWLVQVKADAWDEGHRAGRHDRDDDAIPAVLDEGSAK